LEWPPLKLREDYLAIVTIGSPIDTEVSSAQRGWLYERLFWTLWLSPTISGSGKRSGYNLLLMCIVILVLAVYMLS